MLRRVLSWVSAISLVNPGFSGRGVGALCAWRRDPIWKEQALTIGLNEHKGYFSYMRWHICGLRCRPKECTGEMGIGLISVIGLATAAMWGMPRLEGNVGGKGWCRRPRPNGRRKNGPSHYWKGACPVLEKTSYGFAVGKSACMKVEGMVCSTSGWCEAKFLSMSRPAPYSWPDQPMELSGAGPSKR